MGAVGFRLGKGGLCLAGGLMVSVVGASKGTWCFVLREAGRNQTGDQRMDCDMFVDPIGRLKKYVQIVLLSFYLVGHAAVGGAEGW